MLSNKQLAVLNAAFCGSEFQTSSAYVVHEVGNYNFKRTLMPVDAIALRPVTLPEHNVVRPHNTSTVLQLLHVLLSQVKGSTDIVPIEANWGYVYCTTKVWDSFVETAVKYATAETKDRVLAELNEYDALASEEFTYSDLKAFSFEDTVEIQQLLSKDTLLSEQQVYELLRSISTVPMYVQPLTDQNELKYVFAPDCFWETVASQLTKDVVAVNDRMAKLFTDHEFYNLAITVWESPDVMVKLCFTPGGYAYNNQTHQVVYLGATIADCDVEYILENVPDFASEPQLIIGAAPDDECQWTNFEGGEWSIVALYPSN